MKRVVFLLAVAALLAALIPTGATAHPKQARAIKALNAKLNCLVRYPVGQFSDYAFFGLAGAPGAAVPVPQNEVPTYAGFDPANPATYPFAPAGRALFNWGPTTGLDLAYAPFRPDAWLVGVRGTPGCRKKYRIAANPASLRPLPAVKARLLAGAD